MKRSEMVREINEVFKELFPYDNYEDVADEVLLLVENRGMSPPDHYTESQTEHGYAYNKGFVNKGWEPENEE